MRKVMRIVWALVTLALFGALAFALWPARLGGSATFVVVRGHSMEGTYAQGDLLYARTKDHYAVGDVAVYRIPKGDPGAGALVVHRIKAILPNGHYLFQGDNKAAPDDETPSRADIVAAPLLDLGDLPTRLLMIAPFVGTLIVGIAVAIAMWPSRAGEEDAEEAETDPGREADLERDAAPVKRFIVVAADLTGPDVAEPAEDEARELV
jgi:signal peptidase I